MNQDNNRKTRIPRSADTREKTSTRKKVWKPSSALDAGSPPPGTKYRWIRAEFGGQEDRRNVTSKFREGYELVKPEEVGIELPTMDDGRHAGHVGVGGLMLAKIDTDLVDQRNAYYRQKTQNQMDAVDNDLMRNEHPSMPISKPDRQSRVTFGGQQKFEDS